jgi:hypothetical protein
MSEFILTHVECDSNLSTSFASRMEISFAAYAAIMCIVMVDIAEQDSEVQIQIMKRSAELKYSLPPVSILLNNSHTIVFSQPGNRSTYNAHAPSQSQIFDATHASHTSDDAR